MAAGDTDTPSRARRRPTRVVALEPIAEAQLRGGAQAARAPIDREMAHARRHRSSARPRSAGHRPRRRRSAAPPGRWFPGRFRGSISRSWSRRRTTGARRRRGRRAPGFAAGHLALQSVRGVIECVLDLVERVGRDSIHLARAETDERGPGTDPHPQVSVVVLHERRGQIGERTVSSVTS